MKAFCSPLQTIIEAGESTIDLRRTENQAFIYKTSLSQFTAKKNTMQLSKNQTARQNHSK
jgi:hypothetical protein